MVTPPRPVPQIVVMGASGSGKSTVGTALALSLEVAFVDADDMHPASNIEKMSNGTPLDDTDRYPWLENVGHLMSKHGETGIVLACSVLRVRYRDIIRSHASRAYFVHLAGDAEVLATRMRVRSDHFMPLGLLDTQLKTLEPLGVLEAGCTVSGSAPVVDIVDAVTESWLHRPSDRRLLRRSDSSEPG